jgi:hypothetical protein
MRNIIDLYEASILDIDGSIEYGDQINDQFEKLKDIVCNHREYKKLWRGQNKWNLYLSNDIDTLLRIILFDSSTKFFSRSIECKRSNKPTNSGGWIVVWEWSFTIEPSNSKPGKTIIIKVEDANANMSLTKFLKTHVAPHFKDLGSFKKLIENNTLDRL